MTDNEIIKAYGCCNLSHDECGGCDNCPCKIEGDCIVPSGFELEREVFNLLHRQKAEIERLQKLLDDKCDRCIAKDKAEAVKEFAERLKEKFACLEYVIQTNRKTLPIERVKAEVDAVLQNGCSNVVGKILKETVGEEK